MREELEEIMKQQEKDHDKSISPLRKHLLRHIRDMQIWKGYLERDREYVVQTLSLITDEQCEKLDYEKQIKEIDQALVLDNQRLEKLIAEREIEAAEVVSVNIGKKKKRIKKDDPLLETVKDKQQVNKKSAGATNKRSLPPKGKKAKK